MQIAKITLYDGRVFYTDDYSHERLRRFFDNVRAKAPKPLPTGLSNQVDLIEMTPEEYHAIGTNVAAAELFGSYHDE